MQRPRPSKGCGRHKFTVAAATAILGYLGITFLSALVLHRKHSDAFALWGPAPDPGARPAGTPKGLSGEASFHGALQTRLLPQAGPLASLALGGQQQQQPPPPLAAPQIDEAGVEDFYASDESYHVVFSTGCSEFQDWQSIGVYSSAERVGQRGPITRIASGCTEEQVLVALRNQWLNQGFFCCCCAVVVYLGVEFFFIDSCFFLCGFSLVGQEAAIRHSVSHLPARCRVHFAPNTEVRDMAGKVYKYANKPLGMMHWLLHADPPVPPQVSSRRPR